jgi:hypothetical protein
MNQNIYKTDIVFVKRHYRPDYIPEGYDNNLYVDEVKKYNVRFIKNNYSTYRDFIIIVTADNRERENIIEDLSQYGLHLV